MPQFYSTVSHSDGIMSLIHVCCIINWFSCNPQQNKCETSLRKWQSVRLHHNMNLDATISLSLSLYTRKKIKNKKSIFDCFSYGTIVRNQLPSMAIQSNWDKSKLSQSFLSLVFLIVLLGEKWLGMMAVSELSEPNELCGQFCSAAAQTKLHSAWRCMCPGRTHEIRPPVFLSSGWSNWQTCDWGVLPVHGDSAGLTWNINRFLTRV